MRLPTLRPKRLLALMTGQRAARPAAPPAAPIAPLRPPRAGAGDPEAHLTIPVVEGSKDTEIVAQTQLRGRFFARQDQWEELSEELRDLDRARATTPAGVPLGELLAYGARADVVEAAEHALAEGAAPADMAALDGVQMLEEIRRDHPDDPYLALVVALAHVDIAWAWRGTGWDGDLPELNRRKCIAHFDRAASVMNAVCGIETNSPLIAAGQCALLAGRQDPHLRVADDYEDLIDLDPANPRHMRALGYHLLPKWFGTYQQLNLEARRTAMRTRDIWGNGGYTWVMFDAITLDKGACGHVDAEFFVDGIRDILAARPGQEMVNLMAAYCAMAIRADDNCPARQQISDCASWLIRDHLTEVHPLVWAHAERGFANNAHVPSLPRFSARGRSSALRAIAAQFKGDISKGMHVTFTAEGPRLTPAQATV